MSILYQAHLRYLVCPTTTLMYDWMHCLFVSGVFNRHMGQLMHFLGTVGTSYGVIHSYMKLFRWPKRIGNATGTRAFEGSRARTNASTRIFKCSASEGLGIIRVMAQYARAMLRSTNAVVRSHALCFLYLFTIVHFIEASGRQYVDPESFRNMVGSYLHLYKSLYGTTSMVIKFHWLHHFSVYLARWGCLPSCWTLERKHRLPKKFANNIRNTNANFDSSCLREVTCYHLANLRKDKVASLVPGRISKNRARVNIHEIVCVGDVIMVTRGTGCELAMGRVVAFPTASTCTLRMWTLLEKDVFVSRWSTRCTTPLVVDFAAIKAACVHAESENVATVLHPSRF